MRAIPTISDPGSILPPSVAHDIAEIAKVHATDLLCFLYEEGDWRPRFGFESGWTMNVDGNQIMLEGKGSMLWANAISSIKTGDRIKIEWPYGLLTIVGTVNLCDAREYMVSCTNEFFGRIYIDMECAS
jgi:hypothetical protein